MRLGAAPGTRRQRACSGSTADAAVAWMVRTIERHAGVVRIGDLTERTGWWRTRLTETFRTVVGVTPKRFARIARFRRALELVIQDDGSLSRVALDAGYYDQPHFNAEFREMSGFTPSAYRAARRFPQSPSLVEQAG